MWGFIYDLFQATLLIILALLSFKNSAKISDQKTTIDQLKREKAQLEREVKSSKVEEKRVKDQIITMKDKAQLEKIVEERMEARSKETAATIAKATLPSKKKHTGRSTFNVTTGSQSARSTSQPSSFDPILYSTASDTSSDDSHRHTHSGSHHHSSSSSSSHHSYDSGSSHSSHDSGSSSSYDSGSSSSYDSGGGGSFD